MSGARRARTPWQRIMMAYRLGRGVHFTPHDVWRLAQDGAIETKAGNDDVLWGEHPKGHPHRDDDIDGPCPWCHAVSA